MSLPDLSRLAAFGSAPLTADTVAGVISTSQQNGRWTLAQIASTIGGSSGRSPFFNVKDYGAVGDGTGAALSTVYGSLAAAQAAYSTSFTGSISSTTLTVTGPVVGYINIGDLLFGSGVTGGTTIVSQLTSARAGGGGGGIGTYQVSASQTVSGSMTSTFVTSLAASLDWAAMQFAFAVSTGGGIIYWPPGSYKLTGAVIIPNDTGGRICVGAGGAGAFPGTSIFGSFFDYLWRNNINAEGNSPISQVDGLVFQNNFVAAFGQITSPDPSYPLTTGNGAGCGCLYFPNTSFLKFSNVSISAASGVGLYFPGITNIIEHFVVSGGFNQNVANQPFSCGIWGNDYRMFDGKIGSCMYGHINTHGECYASGLDIEVCQFGSWNAPNPLPMYIRDSAVFAGAGGDNGGYFSGDGVNYESCGSAGGNGQTYPVGSTICNGANFVNSGGVDISQMQGGNFHEVDIDYCILHAGNGIFRNLNMSGRALIAGIGAVQGSSSTIYESCLVTNISGGGVDWQTEPPAAGSINNTTLLGYVNNLYRHCNYNGAGRFYTKALSPNIDFIGVNLFSGGATADRAGQDETVITDSLDPCWTGSASNVGKPAGLVLVTNNTTPADGDVLHFASLGGLSVPGGYLASDLTSPSVIPSGATVYFTDTVNNKVYLNKCATGGGVGSGDSIQFSVGTLAANGATAAGNNVLHFASLTFSSPGITGNSAVFTGSISTTTLSVSAVSAGTMVIGDTVLGNPGSGITTGTLITAQLTFTSPNASFTGSIAPGGSPNVGILTASSVTGTINANGSGPGDTLLGSSVAAGTRLLTQLTGTPGGAGTYEVSISQTVTSRAMTSGPAGGTGTYSVNNSQTVGSQAMVSTTTPILVTDQTHSVIPANTYVIAIGGSAGAFTVTLNNNATGGGVVNADSIFFSLGTLITNAVTPSGANILHFAATAGLTSPVGLNFTPIADLNTPSVIRRPTYYSSSTGTTITLGGGPTGSGSVTGAGVGNGDSILFSVGAAAAINTAKLRWGGYYWTIIGP